MSKRLIMLCAIVFAISFAIPAFAAVQNVKVSGDLLTRGISRTRITLSDALTAAATYGHGEKGIEGYFDAAARIRVDADLTDGVSVTMRTITERQWGVEDAVNATTDLNLDLAYVTLKDILKFVTQVNIPFSLVVGRQELRYGNALIIGDPDTNMLSVYADGTTNLVDGDLSLRKSFDAIKGTLDYNPLIIDLVYSKVAEGAISRYVSDNNDTTLYGINANYTGIADTVLEGYLWLRDRAKGVFANQPTEDEKTYTAGVRTNYSGLKLNDSPLVMGLEAAYQFGTIVADTTMYPDIQLVYGFDSTQQYDRSAMAIQGSLAYTFPKVKYTPTLSTSYTYFSGQEGDSSAGTLQANTPYRAWDPMYEDQGSGSIANALFVSSNTHVIQLSAILKPTDDISLKVDWTKAFLARLYQDEQQIYPKGFVNERYFMTSNRDFYDEFDAKLTYDYTEDVQMCLGGGVLIPGGAFSKTQYKVQPASQVIGSMKVTF